MESTFNYVSELKWAYFTSRLSFTADLEYNLISEHFPELYLLRALR